MSDRASRLAPRVVCSAVSSFPLPLRASFPLFARAGFSGVEVMVTKDPDTRDPARLRELAERWDLPITAIHAPFLLMTRSVWGSDPIGKIDRAIELAGDLEGDPLVVVHPPYRWQGGYRRWLIERLPEVAAQTGVRVAVENMFPIRMRGRSLGRFHAVHTLEELEGFPHVVLDTSHAAVAGFDPSVVLERLGPRLSHVHLSNNAGRGWDSHLPLDRGVLPLEAFVEHLAASGYTGDISLEIDLRGLAHDPDALVDELASNRRFCTSRLPVAAR